MLEPIPMLVPVPLWSRFRFQLFWLLPKQDYDSRKFWNHLTLNSEELSFLRPQLFDYGAVLVVLPAFVAVRVLVGDVVDEDGQLLVVQKIAKDAYLLHDT